MDGFREELLNIFRIEYKDHIENIRTQITALEEGDEEEGQLQEAFRAAHSLKGAARAVDLEGVRDIAHRLETLFQKVQDKIIDFDSGTVSVVNKVIDGLEDYTESVIKDSSTKLPVEILQTIDTYLREQKVTAKKVIPEPQPDKDQLEKETPEEPPELPDKDKMKENMPAESPLQKADVVKVNARNLDILSKTTEQLLVEETRYQGVSRQIIDVITGIGGLSKYFDQIKNMPSALMKTIEEKPEYSRFISAIAGFEKDLNSLRRITKDMQVNQESSSWATHYLSRQLQKEIQTARMVPAGDVYQYFRKMVRDVAGDEKKSVNFKVKGFDLKADKMVLQYLKDPIMHILRNAISHGIESKEERKRQGKGEEGNLLFNISATGNRMEITIKDDGAGIDYQKIAGQAIKKKIYTEEEVKKISRSELLHLIFQSGFSTSKMITDVSGRGMGMSCVQDIANRLQGEITVNSEEGQGTEMIISVPLSISSHRVLMLKNNNQIFGVVATGIDRVCRIDVSRIESIEGTPIINIDKIPVPFVTLSALLGTGDDGVVADSGIVEVIIVKSVGRRLVIALDEMLSERSIIIKDLPVPVDSLPWYSGGFLLEDGSVGLLLNPSVLIDSFRNTSMNYKILEYAESKPRINKIASILVVDDSITTRTMVKTILESRGYNVIVATDGMEALHTLQIEDLDLVVTDIRMPRMDGFTLIEKMKAQDKTKDIPVIIVSAVDDEENKVRGMELGADAYIVKQKFHQQNLLDTVRQIL